MPVIQNLAKRRTSAVFRLAKDIASDGVLGRNIKESIKKHGLSRAKSRHGFAQSDSCSLSRPAAVPRKRTHSPKAIPSRKPSASHKCPAVISPSL